MYILIAGGIGITPYLSVMAYLNKNNIPFELHYAAKSISECAFYNLFNREYSSQVKFYFSDRPQRLEPQQIFKQQPLGTHIHLCTPHGLTKECRRAAKVLGYPDSALGVKPDIITLAKGITSGYLPLSATVTQQHIFDAFLDESDPTSHFRHINTYGGNPADTALSLKNIELIETEQLADRADKMGAYLMAELSNLADHPLVGDIRGKGLLLGIELVTDKETKEPLAVNKVGAVVSTCMESGVRIGRNRSTIPGLSNVLIIAPPVNFE